MKHIVIFRTSGSFIDYNTYNCQELGLAKALVDKGYRVSLIMGGLTAHFSLKTKKSDVDIYYLPYKSFNQSLCIFSGWKELLNRLKPDVIQIHELGMFMSFLVSKWAKNNDIRCVLIQGNYDTTQKALLKQLECLFNYTFGKYILKNVNAIGCKTNAAERYVKRYSDRQTVITPIGLDESKFDNNAIKSDFRKQYGLIGKKVLLYIGKMESRRNPMFLLDLMKRMSDDFSLILVGDGPLFDRIKYRINNEHINNVLALGKKKQEDLPNLYASSDLFLLASNYEIYGMVLLEAMYFGCPVVSTMTAGAHDLIDSGVDGIIMDGRLNIDRWVDTIRNLFNDKALLMRMRKKASYKVRMHFVWNSTCEEFIKIYDV